MDRLPFISVALIPSMALGILYGCDFTSCRDSESCVSFRDVLLPLRDIVFVGDVDHMVHSNYERTSQGVGLDDKEKQAGKGDVKFAPSVNASRTINDNSTLR